MLLTKHGPSVLAGAAYESDMPAYAGVLDDEQIIDVLSYVKSTWPPSLRLQNDSVSENVWCGDLEPPTASAGAPAASPVPGSGSG